MTNKGKVDKKAEGTRSILCYAILPGFMIILAALLKPIFMSPTIIGNISEIPNCRVVRRDTETNELVPTLETVEIHQVDHGVKFVQAETFEGAMYGMGFVHAKDRLW